jgi:hypothetical protein
VTTAVADTNIYISALLFGGPCEAILINQTNQIDQINQMNQTNQPTLSFSPAARLAG